MSQFIVRTLEEDKEFAMMVATFTIENYKPSSKKEEPKYCLSNEKIYEVFPDLKFTTLQKWCMAGKVGKMGTDSKYYVTLKEIENFLFKK